LCRRADREAGRSDGDDRDEQHRGNPPAARQRLSIQTKVQHGSNPFFQRRRPCHRGSGRFGSQ
jgi:hypothetical protein